MKKLLLAAAVATLVSGSALASTDITGGTIYIDGNYIATSCDIAVDDGTPNKNIILKDLYSHQLKGKSGEVLNKTPFAIQLTNCSPFLNQVNVNWAIEGSSAQDSQGYFINDVKPEEGGADKLNIAILNADGKTVRLLSSDALSGKDIEGGKQFEYEVGYVAPEASAAVPGGIHVEAVYNVTYE